MEWQDISTAPKDKQVLLYWTRINAYPDIYGMGEYNSRCKYWDTSTFNLTYDYRVPPTHWAPLEKLFTPPKA